MHTTNYYNAFISISDDCPVKVGEIPVTKKPTIASLLYDMIQGHPYEYTSDDILFTIHAKKNELAINTTNREFFFSKGQACLRACPLTKRYGWGVHFDANGKVAIYPADSEEYNQLSTDPALKQVKAMRNKRA